MSWASAARPLHRRCGTPPTACSWPPTSTPLLTRLRSAPPGAARERLPARWRSAESGCTAASRLRGADGSVRRRGHQLLHFDPRGDGEVIEVLGDLSRARHVAVFVPGTGSDLQRYPGTLARMVPFASADPTAGAWWCGRAPTSPTSPSTTASCRCASTSSPRPTATLPTARDRHWLRTSPTCGGPRRAGADVTVLGHSYGGSIVGSALAHGLAVDRVVHVSSAGTYARTRPHAGGAQVFSMTAPDDPIQLSQGHDLDDAPQHLAQDLTSAGVAPEAAAVGLALRAVVPGGQVGHGADPDVAPGVVRLDTGPVRRQLPTRARAQRHVHPRQHRLAQPARHDDRRPGAGAAIRRAGGPTSCRGRWTSTTACRDFTHRTTSSTARRGAPRPVDVAAPRSGG